MISTLLNKQLYSIGLYFERIEQHPWRVTLCVSVFGLLWYFNSLTVALFWSVVLLSLLIDLPARPFLVAALAAVTLTPIFYFLERPLQAERIGVLVFALLAIGTIVNLGNTWRQPRNRLD